jgi:hypothetical protein
MRGHRRTVTERLWEIGDIVGELKAWEAAQVGRRPGRFLFIANHEQRLDPMGVAETSILIGVGLVLIAVIYGLTPCSEG